MVFNTGPYTVLPDNSILITASMQSETGFPSSHQLKSYVASNSKSRLKLAARAVPSADAGLLVRISQAAINLGFKQAFNTIYIYHALAQQFIRVDIFASCIIEEFHQ